MECSFLCTDLFTCISLCSFCCNLILVFQKQSLLQNLHTCIPLQFLLWSSNTCILASSFIITHIHVLSTEKTIVFIKQANYKVLVPTEYMTREKLRLLSFIPSILFSSSCLLTSFFFSTPSSSYSLCFPFSLLLCTSVSSLLDSGHENCSSSESWPLCQPAFPTPRQSFRHPSLNPTTHSTPLTSSKPLPFTPRPFVASFSLLLTSGLLLPLSLCMPYPCQKTYKQPWPWHREHMTLCDYRS